MKLWPATRGEWVRFLLRLAIIFSLLSFAVMFSIRMPGRSYSGPWQPLSSEETILRDKLRGHVTSLAENIGERNYWNPAALQAAIDYIEASWRQFGCHPTRQSFLVEQKTVHNLELEFKGSRHPQEILVVGAHYDSVLGCPGANDNATGAAALLELAGLLRAVQPERTVRLVAFVNEEPPYFQTENMGSRNYAKRCRQRGENIIGMLSLETIGYYSEAPHSQFYPFPFSWFYPNKANFIAFVGNLSSRDLLRSAIQIFRRTTLFPSEGAAGADWITGFAWSDHWSFWQEGYPAIMVTDTALFRYQAYHTDEDTPEKLDYDRMARVVSGLGYVILQWANQP